MRTEFKTLNPGLGDTTKRSGFKQKSLAAVAGIKHHQNLCLLLSAEKVRATPQTVARLQRVADAVDFPRDEIFLDEVSR